MLAVNAAVGSYVSSQGAYDSYTQQFDPLVVMGAPQDHLAVRCFVDEILVSRLPSSLHIRAEMSLRGSYTNKVPLEFVRVQPYVSPKIELSNQRQEKVDLRVLPVIFRFEKKDAPVYPGQLVDVLHRIAIAPARPDTHQSECDEQCSIIQATPGGQRRGIMKYSGILRIGFKLLVNDKGKFSALLIGITFAVFLMMQMTAMFAGILNRAFSTVTNIGATMWIMDPAVNTATSAIPMPDYLLDAVRSMDGVSYAVPLFIGGALVKLDERHLSICNCRRSGRHQPVWPSRTRTGQYSGHLCRQLLPGSQRR